MICEVIHLQVRLDIVHIEAIVARSPFWIARQVCDMEYNEIFCGDARD